jgi:hypothetical protein
VFFEVRADTQGMMLECEDCSSAWDSPAQVSATGSGYLGIDIDSRFADEADIARFGLLSRNLQQATD